MVSKKIGGALVLAAAFLGCSHGGISVSISPGSANLAPSATQAFSASVSGATDTAVVWVVQESNGGSITQDGIYTAPANTGTFHVIAASHADPQALNQAVVTVAQGVGVSITPHSAVVQTGLTQSFSAAVVGSADTAVSWSVAEGAAGGSINSSGVYTAPNTPGTYHVVAKAHADETRQDASTVAVSAPGVVLTPPSALVVLGTTQQFSGTVVGFPPGINWSVQEGVAGGAIDANGMYTPPSAAGTYHIVATSQSNPSKTTVGVITVVETGRWINVTPPSVNLTGNFVFVGGQEFNYGAQEVVADPNNPGTAYVNITYQGTWKTVDFGATWQRLGDGSGPMDTGRAGMAIAPDGSYIISSLLYPIGHFANGAWKSRAPLLAEQSSWELFTVPGVPDGDMGTFHIDPDDKNHVFGLPHTPTGSFYESTDGGEHWTAQPMPPSNTGIAKANVINGTTLIATYDAFSNITPQLGKKNGSTWTWSAVTFTAEAGANAEPQTAIHGAQQIFVDKSVTPNVIYMGGLAGIQKSTDGGQSWVRLNTPNSLSESIVATRKNIYSVTSFASTGTWLPNFQHAPRASAATGSNWVNGASETPASMTNGWLGAAVAENGQHSVIIAGCWDAGIFIYVEP